MRRSFFVLLILICGSAIMPLVANSETEQTPPAKTDKDKEKPVFPTLESGPCQRDSDCYYNYKHARPNGKCCAGTCRPDAVNGATADKIEAYCKKVGYEHDDCPTKKCAYPPKLRCVNNSCQLKK